MEKLKKAAGTSFCWILDETEDRTVPPSPLYMLAPALIELVDFWDVSRPASLEAGPLM